MNEAPKKIWVIRDKYVVDPEKTCERIVPYIRADLVDGLVEAMEKVLRISDRNHDAWYAARAEIAALKTMEEE